VSLQGSFETIALSDVMALLAASNKSGELRVVGGQVEGRLWLQDGHLVASKVGKAQGLVDAIFELLRLTEGNFVFKDGAQAPEAGEATPVDGVMREAEERLREWHDIVTVVPSVEHRVRLIPDLATPEITLSAEEWHLVMAVALAGTVQGVLEELKLGQFLGCRGLRRLVDAGVVLVEEPRVRPAPHRGGRRSGSGTEHNGVTATSNGFAVVNDTSVLNGASVANAAVFDAAFNAAVLNGGATVDSERGDGAVADHAPVTNGDDADRHRAAFLAARSPALAEALASVIPAGDLSPHFPTSPQNLPPQFDYEADWPDDDAVEPSAFALAHHDDAVPDALRRRRARRPPAAQQVPGDDPSDDGHGGDLGGDPINRGMLLKFLSSVRS
jgi:hypothetical protein